MNEHYNLKYMPSEVLKNKNVFLEEFYTSVDTDIYINGEKCELINSIQYSVQEQLHPIYGYNSYTYDDVSIGNRIVAGTIRIPITNYDDFIKDFTIINSDIEEDEEEESTDKAESKPSWAVGNNTTGGSEVPYSMIINDLFINGEIITYDNIRNWTLKNDMPVKLEENTTDEEPQNEPSTVSNDIEASKESYKKPKYERDSSPFFKEYYSNEEFKEDLYRSSYRHNYCDIELVIGSMATKTLKHVIFRSVDGSIDAEGDPLFETLQFIARDLIETNPINN